MVFDLDRNDDLGSDGSDAAPREEYPYEFPAEVTVTVPRDTWEYVVDRHGPDGADPDEVDPDEFAAYLVDLVEFTVEWEVEKTGRIDATEAHDCWD